MCECVTRLRDIIIRDRLVPSVRPVQPETFNVGIRFTNHGACGTRGIAGSRAFITGGRRGDESAAAAAVALLLLLLRTARTRRRKGSRRHTARLLYAGETTVTSGQLVFRWADFPADYGLPYSTERGDADSADAARIVGRDATCDGLIGYRTAKSARTQTHFIRIQCR